MLETFDLDGHPVDALDLKCLLVSAGMQYPQHVYDALQGKVRLADPSNFFACNCVILPGDVAVHLNQNPASPFGIDLDEHGAPGLYHRGRRVAPVSFPRPSGYYEQQTAAGIPYGSYAVLEGEALLAFFYLWSCEYIKTGETCAFCFQVMAEMAGFQLPSATPEEVAEIIAYGVEQAGVREVQLTAGTKFVAKNECAHYAEILRAIDRRLGLANIPSEIYIYMTAQKDPSAVDEVFDAGVHRVAHDLHVWDAKRHARYAPGHARKVGRDAQLRSLEYIASKHGPDRAFSAFVAGLEPLESMLEGATWCAERGIAPAFSVWMPTPGSTGPENTPPGLEYYRAARREFARLYKRHSLRPPGIPAGSHVSLCHDIYRNMDAILGAPVAG